MRNGAAQHIEARAANSTAMHGRILPDAPTVIEIGRFSFRWRGVRESLRTADTRRLAPAHMRWRLWRDEGTDHSRHFFKSPGPDIIIAAARLGLLLLHIRIYELKMSYFCFTVFYFR